MTVVDPSAMDRLRTVAGKLLQADRILARDPTQLGGQLLARIDPDAAVGLMELLSESRTPQAPIWLCPLAASMARPESSFLSALSGHANSVEALALTPDGRLLVSTSWDRTVRVWDLGQGRIRAVLEGHGQYVESVAVDPGGTRTVSGSADGTARIWNLLSGELETTIETDAPVVAVAFHPNGGQLAIATPTRVTVRHLADGSTIALANEMASEADLELLRDAMPIGGRFGLRVMGNPSHIVSLAFSPTGRRLFAGRIGGALQWWELHDGEVGDGGELQTLSDLSSLSGAMALTADGRLIRTDTGEEVGSTKAHRGAVWAITFSPDGCAVVSGGDDGLARIWDAESGELRHTLDGHQGAVTAVATTPDGSQVITGSNDQTVRLWDLSSGKELGVLRGHGAMVRCVSGLPDGSRLVSGSEDGTIRFWEYPRFADTGADEPVVLTGHREGVMAVAALDPNRVVSASQDRTLKIWDLDRQAALHTLEGHTKDVLGVAVRRDGDLVVSAGDVTLRVWNASSGQQVSQWPTHPGGAMCVAVSPDGKQVLSGGGEGASKLWDLASRRQLQEFQTTAPVLGVAISEDGRWGVAGTVEGSVLLLDLATGTLSARTRHRDFVRSVAFGDNGRVISGGGDGVTRIWDPTSNEIERELDADHGPVGAVLRLPDGSLAVSHVEGTIVVWNVDTGTPMKTINAHDGPVGAMALLADGRIVTGSGDKTLRVLRLGAQTEAAPARHTGFVTGVAVSPDAHTVFSAATDRTVRAWSGTSGQPRSVLGGSPAPVHGAALSHDGGRLVTVSSDGSVAVWNTRPLQLAFTWSTESYASTVALTADGRLAVMGGPAAITVVSLEDGSVVANIQSGAVAVGVAGDSIVALDRDGSLRVLDLHSGTERATLIEQDGHEGLLFTGALAVDPTEQKVASVLVQRNDEHVHDNPIRVWDLASGRVVCDLRGHTDWVRGLTFWGADGLVSVGQDGTVRVWDLMAARPVVWFGTDDQLVSVAADPDSGLVVAGGANGALHFLRLGLAAAPDGATSLIGNDAGRVHVPRLEAGQPKPGVASAAAEGRSPRPRQDLVNAFDRAQEAASGPGMTDAPPLVEAIQGGRDALRRTQTEQLARQRQTKRAKELMQRFQTIMDDVADGISSGTQWRQVRKDLRELRTEVRRTKSEMTRAETEEVLGDLDTTLKLHIDELNAVKGPMEEAEKVEKLMDKFADLRARAEQGEPSHQLLSQSKRLQESVQKLGDALEGPDAKEALHRLSEAIETLQQQVAVAAIVQPLVDDYENIMASVSEGVASLEQATETADRLRHLGTELRQVNRNVVGPEGRRTLEELDEVIERHIGQLDGIIAQVEEREAGARAAASLMEEFQDIMESAGGGVSSEAHGRELLNRLEQLHDRIERLDRKAQESDAAEALEQLEQAVDRNLSQLTTIVAELEEHEADARRVKPLMEEFEGIMKSAGGGVSSDAQGRDLLSRLEQLRDRIKDASRSVRESDAAEALQQLDQAVDRNVTQLLVMVDQLASRETTVRLVKSLIEEWDELKTSAQSGTIQGKEFIDRLHRLSNGLTDAKRRVSDPDALDALFQLEQVIGPLVGKPVEPVAKKGKRTKKRKGWRR